MKKFLQKIFSIKNDKSYHKVFTILGFKIKYARKQQYKILEQKFNEKLVSLESLLTKKIHKIIPFNQINILEIHIVDHCNLECKGCTHFAPIAEKSFLSLEEFEADLNRLYEITNGNVKCFDILGGEPLLHPQCLEFLKKTRKIFPKSVVKLITNGILLPEQDDNFYIECNKYDITIEPTKYQLDIDWEKIEQKCKTFNVKYGYFLDSGKIEKKMSKIFFDIEGKQDPKTQFLNCWLDNPGLYHLDHGKIYKCAQAPFIRFFNKAYNLNLKVDKSDYIDLYDNIKYDDILTFLSKPSQFCRYCIKTKVIDGLKWEKSEKKITEWVECDEIDKNNGQTDDRKDKKTQHIKNIL